MVPVRSRAARVAMASVVLLLAVAVPVDVRAQRSTSPITISYGRWGTADEIAAGRVLLSAFQQANPGIRVSQQVADWTTYWTKLPTQMAAHQAPDAFLLDPGYYQVHYAQSGRLVPLDDLIARDHIDMSQFWPEELPTFKYDGHYYELPRDISINMLLWNKTLFAKAGIARAPSSWQELLADGLKLTLDNKGKSATQPGFDSSHIVQWGYGSIEYLDGIVEPLMTEMGGHLWSQPETGNNVQCLIDSPQGRQAVQFLVDLIYKYHASPTTTETGHYQNIFASGKVAMYIDGTFDLPVYQAIHNFQWDIAAFPSWNGVRASMAQGVGNAINADSSNKAAAWALVKWLSSSAGQGVMSANGLNIPSIRTLAESAAFLKGKPSGMRSVVSSITVGVPYLDFTYKQDAFTYVDTELTNQVFTGHESVASGLQKAADGANKILRGRHV